MASEEKFEEACDQLIAVGFEALPEHLRTRSDANAPLHFMLRAVAKMITVAAQGSAEGLLKVCYDQFAPSAKAQREMFERMMKRGPTSLDGT